jgi:4-hydroxybenzoate polyprenyltransferase
MLGSLSQRVLTLLQLTRMALVFTAIADGLCTLLLSARTHADRAGAASVEGFVTPAQAFWAAAVSVGLYGFGMSLNDIIDRRRDAQIAATRPLPSGRIGVTTAHVVCGVLLALAIAGGVFYSLARGPLGRGSWMSLTLVLFVAGLVTFYDLAGKYLVAPGLITLGLIRFFHALVPAPYVPLLWHPLLLLNHVTILSTVAYHWEEKRPALTRAHWAAVLGGLLAVDVVLVAFVASRREGWSPSPLRVDWELLVPLTAVLAFIVLAWVVRRRSETSREAGQKLMLYGLLWLIVYDACFVGAYVDDPIATLAVAMMLPLAYFSVRLMRWWSKLIALSQKPQFKRAGT